ncbi:MAG: (E)-4-hydroxy-3-methylbut-2-enyl-diphosphate synthase [Bacteroidales bacterium]
MEQKTTSGFPVYRSRRIRIGSLELGGEAPVRIQSMCNTDTRNVAASVDQSHRMIEAGAELVRLTTQGQREVEALTEIHRRLRAMGHDIPLVADIHFKPALALDAARVCEKIRINPGNYLRGKDVDDLLPRLLQRCREGGTAIRIGVNHGSLAPEIVEEFGDTARGMVESALAFLRVCRREDFHRVVVSMKASNPRMMIQAVRLLVAEMQNEGMDYPLHLGVTEAGDGLEGRIKSAVGMAPLLLEGLGDTLRVSLTEDPVAELPVARSIADCFPKPVTLPYDPLAEGAWDPFLFARREARDVKGLGKGSALKVVSEVPPDRTLDLLPGELAGHIVPYESWKQDPGCMSETSVLLLENQGLSTVEVKARLLDFCSRDTHAPVLVQWRSQEKDETRFALQAAGELGALLVDGQVDGVRLENPHVPVIRTNNILLHILQAAGARISHTEYIACPSCGRTHFDIVARLGEIRRATSHLNHLKIGVMGCIVNGPGEMADANYGYVGAGPGRVSLYKGKTPRIRNVPEQEALDLLLQLIREEGDWVDPE